MSPDGLCDCVQYLIWLSSGRVVGVNVHPADDASGVDDDDRRHRQRCCAIGVDLRQVQAELQLSCAYAVAGTGENAELTSDLVTGIRKDRERQFLGLPRGQ